MRIQRKIKTSIVKAAPVINFSDISDYQVKEYYPTSKGMFALKGVDVNNGYILLPV